jgi:hypothetical protein
MTWGGHRPGHKRNIIVMDNPVAEMGTVQGDLRVCCLCQPLRVPSKRERPVGPSGDTIS